MGTTVPKLAAAMGATETAAVIAIEIRILFQRIRESSITLRFKTSCARESMIEMANNRRITKVSRVFSRGYAYTAASGKALRARFRTQGRRRHHHEANLLSNRHTLRSPDLRYGRAGSRHDNPDPHHTRGHRVL